MKKSAVPVMVLTLTLSQPVWAERNPADPYEPYNRVMFKINDTADRYVLTPVARGYRAVTPQPVRTGVSNFFNNLRDVVSMGSNLLRLDIKRASEDFVRVGVNSTFGLGGLINIADAGGIPNNKNTLGDTFASWGWKNSNYFVYPLTGPSTVRDSVGNTITSVYPVDNAVFHTAANRIGNKAVRAVSLREQLLDLTDSLGDASIDKYAYTRDIYMKVRARQLGITPPQGEEDNIDIDDLVGEGDAPKTSDYQAPAEAPLPDSSANTAWPERTGTLTLWTPDDPQDVSPLHTDGIEMVEVAQWGEPVGYGF
ncbi:MlaA family lipoprotein [Neisseria animaloris]|uniref:MlaA family lipoprotein n=1 Tax=Neisseria animaloris TaxID=326522 RepID=UPI000D3247DA|nr:MlaA family lipoprotein [Neisseria animaloris]